MASKENQNKSRQIQTMTKRMVRDQTFTSNIAQQTITVRKAAPKDRTAGAGTPGHKMKKTGVV